MERVQTHRVGRFGRRKAGAVCRHRRTLLSAPGCYMSGIEHDHSRWLHSRWGEGDQIGAGNLLTVERRLAALRSVQSGRLYDLSHEISAAAPYLLPNQTPYLLSIWASFRDSIKRRRNTGATNDAGTRAC